jgi:hypothetical protein
LLRVGFPMGQKTGVSESEFYMWRAVFAFAFVDNILSVEEQELLQTYANTVDFSMMQRQVLRLDFKSPPNVVEMFSKITEERHKKHFCVLARALAWCEGNMDQQEAAILKRVHCIKGSKDENILRQSRDYADTYYQYYAKAGISGLLKSPPKMVMRI